jgi:hypothetical protein
MTRKLIYTLFLSILCNSLFAQNIKIKNGVIPKSTSFVTAGLTVPVGAFSSTHSVGLIAEYLSGVSLRHKKATFTYNGTLAYYLGKKEVASNYSYKYPAYSFAAVMGGVSYSPFNKTYLRLVAGPAITFYNKLTGFGVAAKSGFSYKIKNNICVGFSLLGLKTNGSSILWAVGASASMILK